MTPTPRHILRDTSGASIAIALVFFLICAIIGTIVVTAASVNAKAVQTQLEMQQAEFTVGSAAQTIGSELASAQVGVVNSPAETTAPTPTPTVDASSLDGQGFALGFWNTYGNAILAARSNHTSFSSTGMTVGQDSVGTVYGRLTVDQDLNITVNLSHDEAFAADSPYNMTVTVQCIPSYDASGNLVSFSYEQAVIQRTGGAA